MPATNAARHEAEHAPTSNCVKTSIGRSSVVAATAAANAERDLAVFPRQPQAHKAMEHSTFRPYANVGSIGDPLATTGRAEARLPMTAEKPKLLAMVHE